MTALQTIVYSLVYHCFKFNLLYDYCRLCSGPYLQCFTVSGKNFLMSAQKILSAALQRSLLLGEVLLHALTLSAAAFHHFTLIDNFLVCTPRQGLHIVEPSLQRDTCCYASPFCTLSLPSASEKCPALLCIAIQYKGGYCR